MAFRPDWVGIPLAGLLAILDEPEDLEDAGGEPRDAGGDA